MYLCKKIRFAIFFKSAFPERKISSKQTEVVENDRLLN
jgi:hypothetical protein